MCPVKAGICLSSLPMAPESVGQRWLFLLYPDPAKSPLASEQNQGEGERAVPAGALAGSGGKLSLTARHK